MQSGPGLVIQAALVVGGLVAFNQIILLGLVGRFGDTTMVRAIMLTLVASLYAGVYHVTSIRHRRIPAAWSSVALVLLELSMAGVMFPFMVLLVQGLFPAAFLNKVFGSENDWAGPVIFILVIFIGTRGWARYMHRAHQTAQAEASAAIYERLAFEDSLTGLANRRKLEACMAHWLTPDSLERQSVSLLLIDVDRFKRINDGFSHNIGDEVLKRIAQVLQQNIAADDLAVRLAGDEFVVVLRGCSDAQAADASARLTRAVADAPWTRVADGLSVSVSIGCATAGPGESVSEVLRRSDDQMYRAKRGDLASAVTAH